VLRDRLTAHPRAGEPPAGDVERPGAGAEPRPTGPARLAGLLDRASPGRLAAVVALVALGLRVVTAAARFQTVDEPAWMDRSSLFFDALGNGDLGRASASAGGETVTMPGVTTMWVGSAARVVWNAGRGLGLWSGPSDAVFARSPSALVVAQTLMAVATAALVGVLVLLVSRWAGRGAAAVAGLLIATEPFLVAHGAVLHTDELLALLGAGALVATALALGVPERTAWAGRWWAAAMAGALLGGAFLTKLSALALLPPVALLGLWALVAALRNRTSSAPPPEDGAPVAAGVQVGPWGRVRPLGVVAAWWLAGAVVVVIALYPALWVEPLHEYRLLRRTGDLAGTGHTQFFLGERTRTPGPAYYLVALPLRMTPWLLVGVLAAAVSAGRRAATRGFAAAIACMAVPVLVVLSVAAKQFDRYGLLVPVMGAVLVGVALASAVRARPPARGEPLWTGRRAVVATGLAAGVALHSLVVAPWGLAYFNPLLGGGATAQRAIMVGWGEGLHQAGDLIAEREADRCDEVTIWAYIVADDYFPCGTLTIDEETASYVVVYVNIRQREPDIVAEAVRGREVVETVEARGVTYVEIFGPLPAA
jgi:hypothetical protein